MGQQYSPIKYLGAPLGSAEPVFSYPLCFFRREGRHQALVTEQLVPALAGEQLPGMGQEGLQVTELAGAGMILDDDILPGGLFQETTNGVFKIET